MDKSNGRCLQSLMSGDFRQGVTKNNDNDDEKKTKKQLNKIYFRNNIFTYTGSQLMTPIYSN